MTAKRRASVEWANWTHEQNLEMLRDLKQQAGLATPAAPSSSANSAANRATNVAPFGGNAAQNNAYYSPAVNSSRNNAPQSSNNSAASDALSKLLTRKNVKPGPESAQSDRRGNPLGADPNARHTSYGWTSLHHEIADLKSERDYLQAEQAKLLGIIQNDNAKLVEILQEVQTSKAKFLAKIDALEKERAKLKAFSAEVIESNIEGLLSNMPLSDLLKRADITPELQPAHTLRSKLVELVSQIRAQQGDVLQHVLARVETAENCFLSDQSDEVEAALTELSRIASTSPGNILACEAVAESIPKAIVDYVAEHLDEIQKAKRFHGGVRQPKVQQRSNAFMDVRIDSALELIEAQLAGKAPAGHSSTSQGGNVGWLSGAGTDPKSLLLQNNVLKAGMVLLRKKNIEMRARLAAAMNGDAFSSSPPKRRGRRSRSRGQDDGEGRGAQRSRARDQSEEDDRGSNQSDVDASSERESVENESALQQGDDDENMEEIKKQVQEKQRKHKEDKARRAFNNLPAEHQEFIWKVMVGRIGEVVEGHPLSSNVPVGLKEDVVLDVALQIREVMASILVLPISEVQQQNESLSNDALFATVSRALASSVVATEIQVLVNMMMAYLYSKFGSEPEPRRSSITSGASYQIPAPNFPVSGPGAHKGEFDGENDQGNAPENNGNDTSSDDGDVHNITSAGRNLQDDFMARQAEAAAQRQSTLPRYMIKTTTSSAKKLGTPNARDNKSKDVFEVSKDLRNYASPGGRKQQDEFKKYFAYKK